MSAILYYETIIHCVYLNESERKRKNLILGEIQKESLIQFKFFNQIY